MVPEISVVIPLFNKERYIRRTIESVLRQTFQDFEIIIIDSSTDRSTDIVKQYDDPRIIHIVRDRMRAAPARNLGVNVARSDYVAFLDADDEWQPDHLETLVSLRKKYPDAGLYSTPYVKLRHDGRPWIMLFTGITPPPWEGYLTNYLRICSRGDEPVNSSSCAIPRQVFFEVGGFPENLEYGEDQYLWGKISLTYPIAFSWKGLTIYHTESTGRICNDPHIFNEHPFSIYLYKEIKKGEISHEKQLEYAEYIRRKRHGSFFSSYFTLNSHGDTCVHSEVKNITTNNYFISLFLSGMHKGVNFSLQWLYNSSFHNLYRRFLCLIFGSYSPIIDVSQCDGQYHLKK